MGFTELIKMQPSRKKPVQGDIFAIQPEKGKYFFGKVIKTDIKSKDPFINGMLLVYIYDMLENELKQPNLLNSERLLIPPIVVNYQGWLKGYFQTMGNVSVTVEEEMVDFGFWDDMRKQFVDLEGNVLTKEPKLHSFYGLGSYGVIGREIQKMLTNNPEM